MKVGLIDVDGRVRNGAKYPNLALMKLSAWHKARGDEVEFCFPLSRYDRVYASKIFTFTPDIDFTPNTDDFRRGGSGYDLTTTLPDEVEHIMPDYSLYGVTDTAYGYLSRGCPRGCPFCVVAAKEGRASRKVADLREWWNGQRHIKLFDPNLTACPDCLDLMGQLADSGAWVDISQGVDIRLLTDAKVAALNRIKVKDIHFAWDGTDDLEPLFRKWGDSLKIKDHRRRIVYTLTNFGTTMEWNLHRIRVLADCGFDPYVMVYDKERAPKIVRHLQRWVNARQIFKSCTFDEYLKAKGYKGAA